MNFMDLLYVNLSALKANTLIFFSKYQKEINRVSYTLWALFFLPLIIISFTPTFLADALMWFLLYIQMPLVLISMLIMVTKDIMLNLKLNNIVIMIVYLVFFLFSGLFSIAILAAVYEFMLTPSIIKDHSFYILISFIIFSNVLAFLYLTLLRNEKALLIISLFKTFFALIYSILGVVITVLSLPLILVTDIDVLFEERAKFLLYVMLALFPYITVTITGVFLEILSYYRNKNKDKKKDINLYKKLHVS